MTVIDTMNLLAFHPPKISNPIAVRLSKLIVKIDRQIHLVANKDCTPTQHIQQASKKRAVHFLNQSI